MNDNATLTSPRHGDPPKFQSIIFIHIKRIKYIMNNKLKLRNYTVSFARRHVKQLAVKEEYEN